MSGSLHGSASNGCIRKDGEFNIDYIVHCHNNLQKGNVANAFSIKLPIFTNLNIDFLEEKLRDYEDKEVIEFLKYGYPVNSNMVLEGPILNRNHSSAVSHPDQIDKFVKKGLSSHSIIGPFKVSPFDNYVVSPLASVEKADSMDRRIIMDLSFPKGKSLSVNDSIPKDTFLGVEYQLRLPGVDAIIGMIRRKGCGCALMKRDLKDAYRQNVRTDYKDIHLLGFSWRSNLYFDLTHPQGCSSAAYCCQRSSGALKHVYKSLDSDYEVEIYLDDFISAECWSKAFKADADLAWVFRMSNIVESDSKHCSPNVEMIGLGVLFNTLDMTVSVTDQRMEEIQSILLDWEDKSSATLKEVQSLVGKLSFVAACVRPARAFLSRMFASFSTFPQYGAITLSTDFRNDLIWWLRFFPKFNGVSLMGPEEWENPDVTFASDACLSGCGAVSLSAKEYFHGGFPAFLFENMKLDINCLELLTIMVACKIWGFLWAGKRILVQCDNQDSVFAINNLSCHNKFMQGCVREIMLICASKDFQIKSIHIAGVDNRLPDCLSRAHLKSDYLQKFKKLTNNELNRIDVSDDCFRFEYDW